MRNNIHEKKSKNNTPINTKTNSCKYKRGCPVILSLTVNIRYVIGLYLKIIPAKPSVFIGNTTGVMYIQKVVIKVKPLPISKYKVPIGVKKRPIEIPARTRTSTPITVKSENNPGLILNVIKSGTNKGKIAEGFQK